MFLPTSMGASRALNNLHKQPTPNGRRANLCYKIMSSFLLSTPIFIKTVLLGALLTFTEPVCLQKQRTGNTAQLLALEGSEGHLHRGKCKVIGLIVLRVN